MSTRTLIPVQCASENIEPRRGVDTKRCASENIEPRRGVDTKRCASEDIKPRRGMNCKIPHQLERGTSASEDAGPRRRGGLGDLTSVGEGNETFFIRLWKPLLSRRILKP